MALAESPSSDGEGPEEAERWVEAMRLKLQGRTGVQIEAATGVSQSRLSRHLDELGISAQVWLWLHDRMAGMVKGARSVWAELCKARDTALTALAEIRGHVAEIRAFRQRAAEEAKAVLVPLVEAAREHRDAAADARREAATGMRVELTPLVEEARKCRDEVAMRSDEALFETRRALAGELAAVQAARAEVTSAKEDAISQMRPALEKELSEVRKARQDLWNSRDVAIDRIKKTAEEEVARVGARVEKVAEGSIEGLRAKIAEVESEAGEASQHAAMELATARTTLAAMRTKAEESMDAVEQRVALAGSKTAEELGRLGRRWSEVESRLRTTELSSENLRRALKADLDLLDGARKHLVEASGSLAQAAGLKNDVVEMRALMKSILELAGQVNLNSLALAAFLGQRLESERDKAEVYKWMKMGTDLGKALVTLANVLYGDATRR